MVKTQSFSKVIKKEKEKGEREGKGNGLILPPNVKLRNIIGE